jgi:large subunit ribosomal protein L31e
MGNEEESVKEEDTAEEVVEEELEEKEEEEELVEEKQVYPGLPEDVDVIEERIYVVPLWKVVRRARRLHRAKRAARFLREFISRHMKTPNVKVSPEVNEMIWARGIRNPPRRLTVRVVRTSEEEVWVLKHE